MIDLIRAYDLLPQDVEAVEAEVNALAPQILIHNNPRTGL
jgi:hypothetical protein